MTEQELRALVREAIARSAPAHTMADTHQTRAGHGPGAGLAPAVSFATFLVPSGPEGTCIIEPSVMCNHCGYCKSYGH
jgi:hypothetical protein